MPDQLQEFAFIDGDRTFLCRVEGPRTVRGDAWWWFEVSTERHTRHAPFRAVVGDVPQDVARRMIAYYDDLLARRAAPVQYRPSRRPTPAATPAVPADVAADNTAVGDDVSPAEHTA